MQQSIILHETFDKSFAKAIGFSYGHFGVESVPDPFGFKTLTLLSYLKALVWKG